MIFDVTPASLKLEIFSARMKGKQRSISHSFYTLILFTLFIMSFVRNIWHHMLFFNVVVVIIIPYV